MNRWISFGVLGAASVALFAIGYRSGKEAQVGGVPDVEGGVVEPVTALVGADWASRVEEIAGAAVGDLPALWERENQSPEERRMLVARWLDVDLEGAKAFFASKELRTNSIFWSEFAHADPEGALAWVEAQPKAYRGWMQKMVLAVIASKEPALAAGAIGRGSQVKDLLGIIVRNDPSLARGLLVKSEGDYYAWQAVIRNWVEVEPEAALRWARELDDPSERSRALHYAIERLAIADPEAAAAAFEGITFSDTYPRKRLLEGLVGKIADAHSPEVAAKWVMAHCPEGARRDVLFGLISDGPGGLALLDALPQGEVRDRLGRSAWINWRDPDAAPVLKWVDANFEGDQRAEAYGNLAWGLASRNFDAALRLLKDMPEGPARDAFETQVFVGRADNISGEHVHSAIEMVRARYDEGRAGELIEAMVGAGRRSTRAKLFAALPREFHDAHPTATMAEHWAEQDPAGAMAWAEALPEGEGRERALDGLGDGLEPDRAVAEWFNALPPSGGRDRLAASLAYRSRDEPELAFAWAVSIGDDERRAACLRVVARRWEESDPGAAGAAIETAGAALSDREREALLLRIENRGRARR